MTLWGVAGWGRGRGEKAAGGSRLRGGDTVERGAPGAGAHADRHVGWPSLCLRVTRHVPHRASATRLHRAIPSHAADWSYSASSLRAHLGTEERKTQPYTVQLAVTCWVTLPRGLTQSFGKA